MTKSVRAGAVITGKVQGVYFRAETQRAAMQRNVKGWVRNLPNGAVEALFEGEEAAVAAMIEWCWQGSRHSRVLHVDVQWKDYVGDFERFEIVY